MTHVIKRGDTYPPFEKRLRDEDGNAVDLSNASSVSFNMRDETYTTVVSDDTNGRVTINDAGSGVVEYDWKSSDTTDIGSYVAEFVADFGTDGNTTYPVRGNYNIQIVEDIND